MKIYHIILLSHVEISHMKKQKCAFSYKNNVYSTPLISKLSSVTVDFLVRNGFGVF